MATFVLVPGAWASGWHLHRLAGALREAGHVVHNPTLTGLGERAHLVSPQVGLSTHVDDVVGLLEYDDLHDVVLVGHSYGSMVVSGVAGRIPARVSHIVSLDGALPREGEAQLQQMSGPMEMRQQAESRGFGWLVPPEGVEGFTHYVERGEMTEQEMLEVVARLRPHPLRAFTEPVSFPNPAYRAIPRTFISCRINRPSPSRRLRRAQEDGWRIHELEAAHMAPFTHPRQVADILLDLV